MSAWAELGPSGVALVLIAPALLLLSAFLPGRTVARATALGLAVSVWFLGPAGLGPSLRALWSGIWVLAAWRVGAPGPVKQTPGLRPGGVEAGAIGLFLGIAMIALLVAAVARQDLAPQNARSASYGLALIGLGLLHLMLRRDVMRGILAFGAVGLGIQALASEVRDLLLPGVPAHPGAVLLATAVALALTDRLARSRQRAAGSAWVSDAHDLHD